MNHIGNQSRHILASYDVNPSLYIPNSAASTNNRRLLYLQNTALGQYYSSIEVADDGGVSSYNGLLGSIQHRFASHYTRLSNFTWSHCISDVDFTGELAGTEYQNPTIGPVRRATAGSTGV